jgi:hypothetical protein
VGGRQTYPHVVQLLLQLRRLGRSLRMRHLCGVRTPLLLARRLLRRRQGALLCLRAVVAQMVTQEPECTAIKTYRKLVSCKGLV